MGAIRFRANLRTLFRAPKWWAVLALGLLSASSLDSESVTLTTYYPAPSGIYEQMIVTGNTYLARDGGNVGIREPSTWSPAHKLETDWPIKAQRFYIGSGTTAPAYISTGGVTSAGMGLYTSDIQRVTIDAAGTVGIGNTDPTDVAPDRTTAPNFLLQVGDGVAIAGMRARQAQCGVYRFTPITGATCATAAFTAGTACDVDLNCYITSQGGVRPNTTIPINFPVSLLCCPCGGACPP